MSSHDSRLTVGSRVKAVGWRRAWEGRIVSIDETAEFPYSVLWDNGTPENCAATEIEVIPAVAA